MRFVDKRINRATEYEAWLNSLGRKKHPKYSSSSFRYYYAIIFDLLLCQQGLCAYTEKFLTNIHEIDNEIWNGNQCKPFKFAGQLDHYDPKLKESEGWLWDNFFVADTDVNTKNKRQISPLGILKPDVAGFSASNFLQYDLKQHIFIPKITLTAAERKNIRHDLYALGVNFEPIIQLRKKYLNPYLQKIKYSQLTVDQAKVELIQFFTAFDMASKQLI